MLRRACTAMPCRIIRPGVGGLPPKITPLFQKGQQRPPGRGAEPRSGARSWLAVREMAALEMIEARSNWWEARSEEEGGSAMVQHEEGGEPEAMVGTCLLHLTISRGAMPLCVSAQANHPPSMHLA